MGVGVKIELSHCELTVIHVAGELGGVAVAELKRVCRGTAGPLALDLANLRSSDADGVQFIRELITQGATLLGVTPYIELLVKEHIS
jgi:hypothetical protein